MPLVSLGVIVVSRWPQCWRTVCEGLWLASDKTEAAEVRRRRASSVQMADSWPRGHHSLQHSGGLWQVIAQRPRSGLKLTICCFRIIACGDTIHNCVVPGSAQVFRFDDMFGLSEELTLRVSDHYPVYCLLNPSVHPKIRRNIQTRASVVIIDKVGAQVR